MARCFSRDSYAGSVISRSTESAGSDRSNSTASCAKSSKLGIPFSMTPADDRAGHAKRKGRPRGRPLCPDTSVLESETALTLSLSLRPDLSGLVQAQPEVVPQLTHL